MDHLSATSRTASYSPSDNLMSAILSHPPQSFSSLVSSLSSDHRFIRSRLVFLLLSPLHFSSALSRLNSLSLSQKSLLLARLLLHYLNLLVLSPSSHSHRLRLLDLDAAILLMAMCDSYSPNNTSSPVNWHSTITTHLLTSLLSPSGLGFTSWPIVSHYIDTAAKCRRFLHVVSGETAKTNTESAADVAAVVSLPSVETNREEGECVVCKEEMEAGRDVCELPCQHRFHWGCAIKWLGKKNTCPCCRFELPTEDVYGEMGRLWRKLMRMSGHC
ncbi:hypothetical protein LUZ60_003941 [Juncus effusus]|nr:hypothetical protein LUZ60_003941 [Juncus effusus]